MSFLDRTFEPHDSSQGLYLVPGGDSSAIERERRVHAAMADRGYRVILSGIGGDEVLGGVPSPMPELADHLMTGDLNLLLKRTTEWCLVDRSPFFHQLFDVSKYIYSLYRQPHVNRDQIPPWLEHSLRKALARRSHENVLNGRRFGLLASSISNGLAWCPSWRRCLTPIRAFSLDQNIVIRIWTEIWSTIFSASLPNNWCNRDADAF